MSLGERFAQLPTAAKLFLILTLVLLPFGLALALMGDSGIRSANTAIAGQAEDRARITTRAVESLIARNALALRIAANAALSPAFRATRANGCAIRSRSCPRSPRISSSKIRRASRSARPATSAKSANLSWSRRAPYLVRLSPASRRRGNPHRSGRRNGDRRGLDRRDPRRSLAFGRVAGLARAPMTGCGA